MALTDYIVAGVPADAQSSNFTMDGMGNRAQPDIPGLSADEMKEVMDELVTKVIAPAMNGALTEAYNNFVTLADFLVPERHIVADDVTDPGVVNTDIPSVKALNKAIDDAVIAAGAADMTKAVYDTNDDGIVDHAALADTATTATSATTATTATNATQLNGQAASYYATSASVTNLSNTVSNSYVPKSGTTMTGALTLSGAPTANLHAATKAYVDSGDSTLTTRMDNLTDSNTWRYIKKVSSLPASPNANTIYLVTT